MTESILKFKYDKYSQRGHDGIIEKIMKELKICKGFFIEFGAWDGIHLSNCRKLFENGWNGCFIEGDSNKYKMLESNYNNYKNILTLNKFVYPNENEGDTVDTLYKEYMYNVEVDLLSIDIDGRDYEIFESLNIKPKLIIIEGGFAFHPCLKQKIPYEEAKYNLQQPLHVMCELAKTKGYTPICFNQDTFLLRNDLYEKYGYFQKLTIDCISMWKDAYYNIFSYEDREWLNSCRKSNQIIKKYENDYYINNMETSLQDVFDIVIPVGPNDHSVIEKQIEFTKKNIINYRNIYLIGTSKINGCITIDESIFPFTMETVRDIHGKNDRNGWYLQQLLKLYAGKVIPNILEKYLVIDADTFFLNPITFINNGKCLYNTSTENHRPYFEHMKKLDEGFGKIRPESGICHHMIFETKYINEIIEKVERNHNETFYKIFLKNVTFMHSGASEYEIYFHYMVKNHSDQIEIRKLRWQNVRKLDTNCGLDYISYHHYGR